MTRGLTLAWLALLGAGCQSVHPLGDDFATLDRDGQLARASEVLGEVFATELGPAGEPRDDREVLEVDPQRIAYRVDEQRVQLAWSQIQDVDVEAFPREPGGPETVLLLLDPELPLPADAVRPLLARAGLKRAYVELARRPPRSGERVRAALTCIRREPVDEPEGEAAAEPAPDPAATAPSQPAAEPPSERPSTLDDAEAQLRRLKRWHAEGLISDEDYERERRALLEGLR